MKTTTQKTIFFYVQIDKTVKVFIFVNYTDQLKKWAFLVNLEIEILIHCKALDMKVDMGFWS